MVGQTLDAFELRHDLQLSGSPSTYDLKSAAPLAKEDRPAAKRLLKAKASGGIRAGLWGPGLRGGAALDGGAA